MNVPATVKKNIAVGEQGLPRISSIIDISTRHMTRAYIIAITLAIFS